MGASKIPFKLTWLLLHAPTVNLVGVKGPYSANLKARKPFAPQHTVDRGRADVQVISKLLYCEKSRSGGAGHRNDRLYLLG
jgi:hypothetical protein